MHTLPHLPPSLACEVYALLCGLLPPPHAESPEARVARADTAMGAVAALQPADAFEALFAAQIIAANAHALDCFDAAAKPGQRPEDVARSRAQAATMMRYMQNGLRMLQRDQARREKALAAMAPATTQPAAMQSASDPAPDYAVQAGTAAAAPDPDPPEPAAADLKAAEEFATTSPTAPPVFAATEACPTGSTSPHPAPRSSRRWSAAPAPFYSRSTARNVPPRRPDAPLCDRRGCHTGRNCGIAGVGQIQTDPSSNSLHEGQGISGIMERAPPT